MIDWPNPITDPDFYDRQPVCEDPSRHPVLPCGYNSAAMNGDEANGAGLNEAIWPVLFDAYEGFAPVILTSRTRWRSSTECPDLTFACPDNHQVFPNIDRLTTELRGRWIEQQIPAQANTLVFKPWDSTQVMSKASNIVQLPNGVEGITLIAQKEMEVTE